MMKTETIRKIVYSLLPAILLFILIETLSFVYFQYFYLDDFMAIDINDSFHNIPELFETRKIDTAEILFSKYFPTRYYVSDRNYRGKTIELEKSSKTYRIFSFGGSCTAGSPWGHEASFSRFLEDELNRVRRQYTKVEVVNFGAGGYGSTRVLGLVEKAMRYKPDLIIIYSGHNEIYDNWIYLKMAKAKLANRFRHFVDYSYTVRVARIIFEKSVRDQAPRIDLLKSNAGVIPSLIAEKKGVKEMERRYFASQLKKNLTEIIRAARNSNASVLLVSEPANFFFEPAWYPEETDHESIQLVTEMRRSYSVGNLKAAMSYAQTILNQHEDNPLAHYFLGLVFVHQGDRLNAQRSFLKAIDYDENLERYVEKYHSIESALHDSSNGIYFIDARKAFMEHLDDGLLDGRLLMDKQHPTVEGNKLIAKTIFNEYFFKHHIREDLFEYGRYDSGQIWRSNIDAKFYFRICERYIAIKDSYACVNTLYDRYVMSGNLADQRIGRIIWEYLFYYGLLTHNANEWIDKAKKIYKASSLITQEAIRNAALKR